MTDHSVRLLPSPGFANATPPAPPSPIPSSGPRLQSVATTRGLTHPSLRPQQIVGPGSAEMPTSLPAGHPSPSYSDLVPYGPRRREAVEVLASRAINMFDDSGVRGRTSVDSIYTLLTGDQMQCLTWDGGRQGREFVDECVRMFKSLVEKRAVLGEREQEAVRGPLGLHLLVSKWVGASDEGYRGP